MKKYFLVLLLVSVVFVSGCTGDTGYKSCSKDSDCPKEMICSNGYCQLKSYHEKPEHQKEVGSAKEIRGLQPGESNVDDFNLNEGDKKVYNIEKRSIYEVFVQATSSVPISYQQKYGPPQLDYMNTEDGKTRFSGGPEMVGGDVQEVAVTIGPAPEDLTGLINVTRIDRSNTSSI